MILEDFSFNDCIIRSGLATFSAIVYCSSEIVIRYIMVTEVVNGPFVSLLPSQLLVDQSANCDLLCLFMEALNLPCLKNMEGGY